MHIVLPDQFVDRIQQLGARHQVTPMEVLERAIALAERLEVLAQAPADVALDILEVDCRAHRATRLCLFTAEATAEVRWGDRRQ